MVVNRFYAKSRPSGSTTGGSGENETAPTIRSDLKRSNNASDFVQRAANKDMALKKT